MKVSCCSMMSRYFSSCLSSFSFSCCCLSSHVARDRALTSRAPGADVWLTSTRLLSIRLLAPPTSAPPLSARDRLSLDSLSADSVRQHTDTVKYRQLNPCARTCTGTNYKQTLQASLIYICMYTGTCCLSDCVQYILEEFLLCTVLNRASKMHRKIN